MPLFLQSLILIVPTCSVNVTTATTSAPVVTAAITVPVSNTAVVTTAGTATKCQ